jgi:hypothetical protein
MRIDTSKQTTTFVATCLVCKTDHTIRLPTKDYEDWLAGKKIQHAMSYVHPDVRELLISGICGTCFDKIFED